MGLYLLTSKPLLHWGFIYCQFSCNWLIHVFTAQSMLLWNPEGDIVLAFSVCPSIHTPEFHFSANNLEFNETSTLRWMRISVRPVNTELWPLISYALCIWSNNRFRATSLQLLAGIQRNFIGTIITKTRWAFCRLVSVRPFNKGFWLLISYGVRI
jgi:hypothetical protein